jgi:hypothetical protein
MALNWTIVGWYRTMSIYQLNMMRTSTLRSATIFVQSNIYSSTYTNDMIVQLLRSHATEGNVVEVDEIKKYLDYRYVFASKAVWRIFKFDMHEDFLLLSVYNTICPISKWCCFMMTMMCTKWQHGHPFLERCSQNGSK